MTLLSIDLHEPVAAPLPKKLGGGASIVFASTNLTRGSVPGRGLLYSFLIHEIALFSLVCFYSYRIYTAPPLRPPEEFRMLSLLAMNPLDYLPMAGGGSERKPAPARHGERPATRPKAPQAAPRRTNSGFTYPGPQRMVSDVPNPTNTFQTILQPELKHPPVIKAFVPLPNLVLMAQAAPPPPLPVKPEPRVVAPVAHLDPEKLPEAPNLKLPRIAPQHLPVMPTAKPPEPRVVVPIIHLAPDKPLEAPKLEVPTATPVKFSVMPTAKPPDPRVVAPAAHLQAEKLPEAPRLAVPRSTPVNLSAMPSAKPPDPRVVAPAAHLQAEKLPEAPRLAVPTAPAPIPALRSAADTGATAVPGTPSIENLASLTPTEGKDARNLLVLSPMPAPAGESVRIPVGEARGRFAISPDPPPAGAKGQPGSKSEGGSSSAVGIGQGVGSAAAPTGAQAGTGNALDLPARTGEGLRQPTEAGSSAKGPDAGREVLGPIRQPTDRQLTEQPGRSDSSAKGLGVNEGGGEEEGAGLGKRGAGSGADNALGTAAGGGTGTGSGPGSGAGSGNGGGAFPGISIQGGHLSGGGTAGRLTVHQAAPEPIKRSYSMTIVSTSSSGGGLADFGVFRNERVYTVYLDMRQTVDDPARSWTLQYAIQRGADAVAGAAGSPITIQQSASSNGGAEGLVPPFPLVKEQPHLPPELVEKYHNYQMVVSAIINKQGKFEQLVVKQSPSEQLNGPLLEALGKWVFRPAELNGEKISVKALLGISIALPQ